MTDYERGIRDALRAMLSWATEHDDYEAIEKIRKVAYVFDVPLNDRHIKTNE